MAESRDAAEAVVAGHICLDIIPAVTDYDSGEVAPLRPGMLVHVGAVTLATGGAVANTGIALHRLGVRTSLMGKMGGDLFGQGILDALKGAGSALSEGMIEDQRASTSYSIVLSLRGSDRTFLHFPGANDLFSASDIPYETLAGASVFHFGYPPLMARFYDDGGAELVAMLSRVRQVGVRTSLDMACPGPGSRARDVSWPEILKAALPYVDFFSPSWDDLVVLLGLPDDQPDASALTHVSEQMLAWGTRLVMIKLGSFGAYFRTANREFLSPCFVVDVAGTDGAGDATIAGLLAAWLQGMPLERAATVAVAVGACCVEAHDATSGILDWEATLRRIDKGWARRETILLSGWRWDEGNAIYSGPGNTGGAACDGWPTPKNRQLR